MFTAKRLKQTQRDLASNVKRSQCGMISSPMKLKSKNNKAKITFDTRVSTITGAHHKGMGMIGLSL